MTQGIGSADWPLRLPPPVFLKVWSSALLHWVPIKIQIPRPYPSSFESESLGLEPKNEVSKGAADDSNVH